MPGIVVEAIDENSEGAKVDLHKGDVFLRFVSAGGEGQLNSPFDLIRVEIEQGSLRSVTLIGERAGESKQWTLRPGTWGINTRPHFQEAFLVPYETGKALARNMKLAEAMKVWEDADAKLNSYVPSWLVPWMLMDAGSSLFDSGAFEEATKVYEEAFQRTKLTPAISSLVLWNWGKKCEGRGDWGPARRHYESALVEYQVLQKKDLFQASLLNGAGRAALGLGDESGAEDFHTRALRIERKMAPESLALAESLIGLGDVYDYRGDLTKSKEYYETGLRIGRSLAPNSLIVSSALLGLGGVDYDKGDLSQAEEYCKQSLRIEQLLAPTSPEMVDILNSLGSVSLGRNDFDAATNYYSLSLAVARKLAPHNAVNGLMGLGLVAYDTGELGKAQEYLTSALAIRRNVERPNSFTIASILLDIANVVDERGDVSLAEKYYREALEIQEKIGPNSMERAATLNNLGYLALERRDLPTARGYFLQALNIKKQNGPHATGVAVTLTNLGSVASEMREFAEAERYYRDALRIQIATAPQSLLVATIFDYLGQVAFERGDLAQAEGHYRKALNIQKKLAPSGSGMARSLRALGQVSEKQNDLEQSEKYNLEALSIQQELAPGTTDHADNLAALARIAQKRGQLEEASRLFEQSILALENQVSRLGGGESVTNFRATHSDYYTQYVEVLVRQGRPELALEALERSRARSLIETLTTSHVDIRKGVDPNLLREERFLKEKLRSKSDRRLRLLNEQHSSKEVQGVDHEIEQLLSQSRETAEKIRENSPAYAALTQPQPLTTKQIQEMLDEDTELLEFSLGETKSYVFEVTTNSMLVHVLPARAEIERLVRRVYALLTERNRYAKEEAFAQREARIAKADADFERYAHRLGRMVLGPAPGVLSHRRLLVVADGALQYIPFAILPASSKHTLIEDHELVTLPSASVIDVLRREEQKRKGAIKSVAVLADPVFSKDDSRVAQRGIPRTNDEVNRLGTPEESLMRSVRDAGLSSLPRLPFSRQEAEAIIAAAGSDESKEALDFDASRTTATDSELREYRVVHFATHGLLNSKHPELSGLVLSMVDRSGRPADGFLSLADIYNLDLPVDLIVLSACETALGKEVSGEGLIGLTRGFMYAGSSRVIASLWAVDDSATAELMQFFYRSMLREGLSPAAALRQAQLRMLKDKRHAMPYYWGAFVIQGDWKGVETRASESR